MKTQLEKFVDLYKDFGIICDVSTHGDDGYSVTFEGDEKWNGYIGFAYNISFDKDGNFERHGAFES